MEPEKFAHISNIRHEKPPCPVGDGPIHKVDVDATVGASAGFLRLVDLLVQQHVLELASLDAHRSPPARDETVDVDVCDVEISSPSPPSAPQSPAPAARHTNFSTADSDEGTKSHASSTSSHLSRKLRASRQSNNANNAKLQRSVTAKVMCRQHEAMPEVHASEILDFLEDNEEELEEVKNRFKPSW